MKIKKALSMVLAVSMASGLLGQVQLSSAKPESYDKGFYGAQLTDNMSIAFYDALHHMNFSTGEQYVVNHPGIEAGAAAYASGDMLLMQQFGAAVDSFRYDHPDHFYVDWNKLTLNITRDANGKYQVAIGSGRTDSYLFKDKNIGKQIVDYDAALDNLTAGVSGTTKEKAKIINDRICQMVNYGYGADKTGKLLPPATYIETAYGALINHLAISEGYSKLYKDALNHLGINCELVSGYFIDGDNTEPRMWVYIQDDDGKWYATDVSKNDVNGGSFDKYFWQSSETFMVDHIENGNVASDKYDMPYPNLNRAWASTLNSGLLDYRVTTHAGQQVLEVTYNGLDAEQLTSEENLYMAFRTQTTSSNSNVWSAWQSAQVLSNNGKLENSDGKTYFKNFGNANTSVGLVEVGVFNVPDDASSDGSKQYSKNAEKYNLVEKIAIENPWRSESYINQANVTSATPSNVLTALQDATKTQTVTIKYDKPLKLTNGTKPEISWTVSGLNKEAMTEADVRKSAYLDESSITFDGVSTITFKFTPSTKFAHNFARYTFSVDNMVNVISKKLDGVKPAPFTITYGYNDASVCSKYYNDNRVYVDPKGDTAVVSNSDLSIKHWRLENDTCAVASQSSGIALVATTPTDRDGLIKATERLVGDTSAIKAIVPMDLDLNLSGERPRLPNGSYMRVSLDYPKGTSANDNLVFRLYHFNRSGSNIKDYTYKSDNMITCVSTPNGLEASIGSCSPYVLVALDANKVTDTSRGLALDFNGKGGFVSVSTSERINAVREGQDVIFTFIPDEGYELEYANLNAVPVEVNSDNKAVVSYNDLLDKDNVFSVGFVATNIKTMENNAKLENLTQSYANSIAMKPETPVKDHKHAMEHIVAADDLCTGRATGEYWHCTVCSKNFKDAMGAEELIFNSHTLTTVAEKPATHKADGLASYKKCSTCGRTYDIYGSEVNLEDLVIPKIEHSFTQMKFNDNSHWYQCECGEKDKIHQHSFDWTIVRQPTTTESGLENGVCTICGFTKNLVTIEKSSHILQHIGRTEATCMHKGTLEYWFCTDCTKNFEDAAGNVEILDVSTPIDPTNHDGEFSIVGEKDPTYTEDGYTGDTVCSHCKKVVEKGIVIPKLEKPHEHTMKYVAGQIATCNSNGTKPHFICTGCNRIFEDEEGLDEINNLVLAKNPTVHAKDRVVVNNRRPANCNTQGYAGDVYCGDCGKLMYNGSAIEKTGRHNRADKISHDASTHYYTCTVCGEAIDSTVAPHAGGRATCVSKAVCAECGVEYGTTDSTKHNHFGVRRIVAPTSANEGYTGDIYCLDCDKDVEKGTSVPKTDHDHQWIKHEAKVPTCHRDGNIEYWECKVCPKLFSDGYGLHEITKEQTIIPKSEHEANLETKITEAGHEEVCKNCGEVKVHSFTPHEGGEATCVVKAVCEICGNKYGALDNNNHKNTYVKNHIAATPTKDGYTGDTYCRDCDNLVAKGHTISSIGHEHPLREVPKFDATCERQGNIEHWKCDVCGEFFLDKEGKIKVNESEVILQKLAHKGTGKFESNVNGHWQICSVCNKDTDIIPHKTEIVNAITPTATKEGYSGDEVCKECGYMVKQGHKLNKVDGTTPSGTPSGTPSTNPSDKPSGNPSNVPSNNPSGTPSNTPSIKPSDIVINSGSNKPSNIIINSGSNRPNNNNSNNNSGNKNNGNNLIINSGNNNSSRNPNKDYGGVQTGDNYTTIAIVFASAALITCLAFIAFKKKK